MNDPAYSLPLIYTERVAKFGETDLRCMFEKQGLEVQEIYGDYNFQPYDKAGSPRLILIAKKMAVH